MEIPGAYILPDTTISTLSAYDILKHTQAAGFMEAGASRDIYPLVLDLNKGVFTRKVSAIGFPEVTVTQTTTSFITSCSCHNSSGGLCAHQAVVIHCILEQKNYRVFFDAALRRQVLLPTAKRYGLEGEPDLDIYFRLLFLDGKLHTEPRMRELIPVDEQAFEKGLLPQRVSVVKELATQEQRKSPILVLGKHRYSNQLNVLLMEAGRTQAGKIKNPVDTLDPLQCIWKAEQPAEIKFYTAITTFQNKYAELSSATELEALKQIARNPMKLDIYHHDRNISETITAKSLQPIELRILNPEIQLTVFRKEPFYEISGELLLPDAALPFKDAVIRNEYFLYYRNAWHLIADPDLHRVIRFFNAHHALMLIHASKYEAFHQSVLAPLGHRVHINYNYLHTATPAQLAEKSFDTGRIIYLQQEGNFISITPVMKYGEVEVPVYSRKQLLDTDQNGNTFRIERDHEAEVRLTAIVMGQHPDFATQIEAHEYFYLHKDQFLDAQWFLKAFEVWRNEGITLLGFDELKKNKLNPYRAKISIEVNSGTDWFNARLTVSFGGQQSSLKQLHSAIRNKRRFVQLDDGTMGILPDEWIGRMIRYFEAADIDGELLKIPKTNFSGIPDLFEQEMLNAAVQTEVDAYARCFSGAMPLPDMPVPAGLNAELRAYQREGLNWLCLLDQFNFGGCLADDMGLGKTLQIIAFILLQREKYGQRTNLVVVPTSLLFNWQDELQKFAPSLKVLLHYGSERQKGIEALQHYEVVLTSYGILVSDIRFLKTFRFNYIFLDESQVIKNPDSERYKAARLLQSRNKIILTGTPVENNTFDLYGQLSFACPGLLGSKQHFKDIYAIPIDKFEYSKRASELQQKIRPFILRRTKKQVATQLPEKTEMVIYCEMNAEQRKVYDHYERELREFISATDSETIQKNSMHVLTGLTKLRQICNAPVLLKEGHSGDRAVKIEVLTAQIESKYKEHKILVFSQFVGMLDLIKTELEQRGIPFEYLTGQTKDRGEKVQHFQTNENLRVFLISLKAGGVGLNLTAADYVYLVDPWWNPAAENQAIDRSHRIGQTRNVIAVRLICSNTIEEKIVRLQEKKKRLAQDLIKTEASFFKRMSKTELLEIL
ncbi:DEAD/DEAH box helicase [Niabella drilacis]|uniref:SNF2 helicase associated n=1 Tax=Niabella drilacis (strain DSM 25811 / CCM 8410 / CCUG 62505 / LMG 26954 / E90) TaxID=1285928 RepID=A0A1G6WAX3_NIADE|nr:DEAD/DEAH box helicase [Niabella drilacis]SDD62944.1 SNF2 helicase associated [Niabella drilacis]